MNLPLSFLVSSETHPIPASTHITPRQLRPQARTDYLKLARPWAIVRPKCVASTPPPPIPNQYFTFLEVDADLKSTMMKKRKLEPVVYIPRRSRMKGESLEPEIKYETTPSLSFSSTQDSSSSSSTLIHTPTTSYTRLLPSPSPKVPSSLTDYRSRQIRSLESQNSTLRQRNIHLKERLRMSEQSRIDAMKEVEEFREWRRRLEVILKARDKRCVVLEYEVGEKKRDVEDFRRDVERKEGEIYVLRREVEGQKEEIERLRGIIQVLGGCVKGINE